MTQTVIRIGSTIKRPPRMRAWMPCQTLRNAVGADSAWGPGTPGGPGTAVDLVSIRVCPERPGSPTGLAERLGLEPVELFFADGARVEEGLGVDNLIRGRRSSELPDIGFGRGPGPLCLRPLPLRHPPAARNDVHERGQERQEDQADEPEELGETAQLAVPEQVHDNLDQDEEVGQEDEDRQDVQLNAPEVTHRLSPPVGPRAKRGSRNVASVAALVRGVLRHQKKRVG